MSDDWENRDDFTILNPIGMRYVRREVAERKVEQLEAENARMRWVLENLPSKDAAIVLFHEYDGKAVTA